MEREGGPCPKRFERKRKHCGKKEIKERDGGPCQKRFERKRKPMWIEKRKQYLKEREGVQKDFIQWVVSKKDLDLEDKK